MLVKNGGKMAKYNEKYFQNVGMTNNSIDDLVETDEQILWRGKPKKTAFILSKILNLLPFVIIWLLFDGFFIYTIIAMNIFQEIPVVLSIVIVVFFLIHLMPVWFWISNVVTAWKQYKNIEYCFTNKRIIVRTGIFIDIKNLYYVDIQNINLQVGLLDRMLKVGDIYITGKFEATVLYDIPDPYFITNKLQKIINDIKTDMIFPNDFRPEENRGFNTKYNPNSDLQEK